MKSYLIIIILLLFIGCSDDEPAIEQVNYEFITLYCLYEADSEFIITTENEYIEMAKQTYRGGLGSNCADTTQAPFDFNKYILMGKSTKIDMNDKLSRVVNTDELLKTVVYKLVKDDVPGPENNGGYSNIYSVGMNWVKVQKPPADYTILIDYSEN